MSHLKSIAFLSEEEALQELSERLQQMSDEELIKFGKMVRQLSAPRDRRGERPLASAIANGQGGVEAEASKGLRPLPPSAKWKGPSFRTGRRVAQCV
jgi:hypothetical protein